MKNLYDKKVEYAIGNCVVENRNCIRIKGKYGKKIV